MPSSTPCTAFGRSYPDPCGDAGWRQLALPPDTNVRVRESTKSRLRGGHRGKFAESSGFRTLGGKGQLWPLFCRRFGRPHFAVAGRTSDLRGASNPTTRTTNASILDHRASEHSSPPTSSRAAPAATAAASTGVRAGPAAAQTRAAARSPRRGAGRLLHLSLRALPSPPARSPSRGRPSWASPWCF